MGDYYDFDFRFIDGENKFGFVYMSADTAWQEIFVEFTEAQKQYADQWIKQMEELNEERKTVIQGWIAGGN